MSSDARQNGDGNPRELTGRMVFLCLVAFFAVVAGANAVLVRAAVSTFGGLETESSYQAGLVFAHEEAEARAQDARHWQIAARLLPQRDGETRLQVDARDEAGRPLRGLTAAVRLVHPADERADHVIALHETRPGEFAGAAEAAAGQWDLVLELARDGARVFRSRNRVRLH